MRQSQTVNWRQMPVEGWLFTDGSSRKRTEPRRGIVWSKKEFEHEMERTSTAARAGRRCRLALSSALIASLGLALTACGSSGSSDAAGSGGSTVANSPASSSAVTSKCAQQAASIVGADLGSSSSNASPYPAQSVNGTAVRGKSFWIVVLSTQVPALAAMAQGFQSAAEAAGAKAHIFDAMASPATAAQGISSAIAAKASGIVLLVVDPALVAEATNEAAAAGIPIVDGFSGNPNEVLAHGIVGATSADETTLGTMEADYALNATHCNLNGAIITSSDVPANHFGQSGIQAEIKRLCSTCAIPEIIDVPSANIATQTVSTVESSLQRDSKINFIMMLTDTYAPYAAQAQKALNTSIPMIGFDGDGVKAGQAGGPEVADVLYPPQPVIGWFLFDGLVRATAGDDGFHITMPIVVVNKSNWGTDPSSFSMQPRYNDYEQTFLKLWGLAG
jgi:ribose transport system substrate-binding protein